MGGGGDLIGAQFGESRREKQVPEVSTPVSPALRGRITACTTTGGLSIGIRENRLPQRLTI